VIAAIGTDGREPVVWGLGVDEAAALDDAWNNCNADCGNARWDSEGSACVAVSPDVTTRIEAGEVSCAALGISVRTDRDGWIVDAEVRA